MSRTYGSIAVEAYVTTADGRSVDADTLSEEQRAALADALSLSFLSAAYAGRAVFKPGSAYKDSVSTSE